MTYYKEQFDKRGFDTMFSFLQMNQQKSNASQLKKAIQDLIKMMTQKTAGQKIATKDIDLIDLEENFDMAIITIVCESVALYLSGKLDKIEQE